MRVLLPHLYNVPLTTKLISQPQKKITMQVLNFPKRVRVYHRRMIAGGENQESFPERTPSYLRRRTITWRIKSFRKQAWKPVSTERDYYEMDPA